MLFPSEIFLFLFLPFTIAIYYMFLRKTKKIKNLFPLLVSLLFDTWCKLDIHCMGIVLLAVVMVVATEKIIGYYEFFHYILCEC